MKKERNIGQEILAGIREIKEWQQGKKKLKTTCVQHSIYFGYLDEKKLSCSSDNIYRIN